MLTDDEARDMAELSSDFCVIKYPETTDRFIRCTLTIKVKDHFENLEYGVWASLSEQSFQDYIDNFSNPDHDATYFGWFANDLPEYRIPDEGIPTNVCTRKGGQRPEIQPHRSAENKLSFEYHQGITEAEAKRRIEAMINAVNAGTHTEIQRKRWWKFW